MFVQARASRPAASVAQKSKAKADQQVAEENLELPTPTKEVFISTEKASDAIVKIPKGAAIRTGVTVGSGALAAGAAVLVGLTGPIGLIAAGVVGGGLGFGATSQKAKDYVSGKIQAFKDRREEAQLAEQKKLDAAVLRKRAIQNATPEQLNSHAVKLFGAENWDSRFEDHAFLGRLCDFAETVAEQRPMPESDQKFWKKSIRDVRTQMKNGSMFRNTVGQLLLLATNAGEFEAGKSLLDDPQFYLTNLKPEEDLREAFRADYAKGYGKVKLLRVGAERLVKSTPLSDWDRFSVSERLANITSTDFDKFDNNLNAWKPLHELIGDIEKLRDQ